MSAARLDPALIARAAARSTATLHEAAAKSGALPARIKPLSPEVTLCGPAFPVQCPSGDNLFLHHAIYAAERGEVLVVDVGDRRDYGYWGEVMAVAAQVRGIAGLVIHGGVRDAQRMVALGFAVFAATPAIRGTGKNIDGAGTLGAPVLLGSVTVSRGDLVIGDSDGVVVLPAAKAAEIVALGERRDEEEVRIFERLRGGESTLTIYNLPTPRALAAKR